MSTTNGTAPPSNNAQQKTMRAVVWEGKPNSVSVLSVPVPELKMPEDAIVRVTSAALCGTDIHTYHGFLGSSTPPWIIGHEAVGVVVQVGSATEQFKTGDRVLVPGWHDVGHYVADTAIVPELPMYGGGADSSDAGGCQAEYVRVPFADDSLVLIPDDFSSDLDWLFLSDIFPTAWAGLDFSGFQSGESVAVFGLGPVGLLCVYAAQLRGASQVFAVDHVRERLDKAASLGAIPIDFTSEHGTAVQQILKRRPEGVMRVVDCVGYEALNARLRPQQNYVLQEATKVASVNGGIGVPGLYFSMPSSKGAPKGDQIDPIYEINMSDVWLKSLTIKAGIVPIYDLLPRMMELVKTGKVKLDWVVSSQMSIEDAPKAYDVFSKKLETKIVFRFPWSRGELTAALKTEDNGEQGTAETNEETKDSLAAAVTKTVRKLPM
ncbi:alcohol dehydrogenase GroES-like domain-containing protein [Triangularia verruculosa]|uniref:Alcohol dehydrogenase GroES-like domain-containing protein n=1 Tax=Triangularia verruculosa TaxID=2587418 RepID=A0AAN6XIZ8_9PEZI|nr:alcohol dehydrogenase GroES-like domain-containing protein [Triangularia verruculosa]